MKTTKTKKPLRQFVVAFKCGTALLVESRSLQTAAFDAAKVLCLRPIDVVAAAEIPR